MFNGCVCEDCRAGFEDKIRKSVDNVYDFIDKKAITALDMPVLEFSYISKKNGKEYSFSLDFDINNCCVCGRNI